MGFDRAKLSSLANDQIANSQLLNEVLRMIEIADLSSANLEHGIFGDVFNGVLYDLISYTEDSDENLVSVTVNGTTFTFTEFKRKVNTQVYFEIGWSF